MTSLTSLHTDIQARVDAIQESQPNWLCRLGCDGCCHRLAQIPELSQAEWQLLQAGLNTLSPQTRQKIEENAATLCTQQPRQIICPMLDKASGACLVYAYRPVACRTYGFYTERGKGLYCQDIEALVNTGVLDHIVWGNHDAINRRLASLGERRNLVDWLKTNTENASTLK